MITINLHPALVQKLATLINRNIEQHAVIGKAYEAIAEWAPITAELDRAAREFHEGQQTQQEDTKVDE